MQQDLKQPLKSMEKLFQSLIVRSKNVTNEQGQIQGARNLSFNPL